MPGPSSVSLPQFARRAWVLVCVLIVVVSVFSALLLWHNGFVLATFLVLFFGALLTPLLGARLAQTAQELEQAQTRLRDEERQRAEQQTEILDSITDCFYAVDAQWRMVYVNAQAQKYFGKTPEEMLARPIWETFPVASGSLMETEYRRAMSERVPVHFEAVSPLTQQTLDLRIYPHSASNSNGGLSIYFRNVTEERRLRDELAASREQLELAIESTGMASGWYDPQADQLRFERNIGPFWGLERSFTSLSELKPLFHPDDLARVQSEIARLIERGSGSYDFEMRFRRMGDLEEAPYRWLTTRGKLVPDNHGTLGMAGILFDITDRKRAEIALQTSEKRYRSLIAATSNIVFLASPDASQIRMIGWSDFTGQEHDEIGPQEWIEMLHPDDRDEMVARWMEVLRDQVACELTYRLCHRSGEYRWVVSRAVPVWSDGGELLEWVGTLTDIHEQKEAEARERAHDQRLKQVMEGADIAVWVWEPEPDVLHYQYNFERVFDLDGPLANYAHLMRLFHPDDVARVGEVVRQHVATCSGFDVEYRIRLRDEADPAKPDDWRWILARAVAARKSETGFVEFTGVCFDISEIKRTSEALRASEASYRALVDVAPQMVFATRCDGFNTFLSPQWFDYTGLSLEESLGWGWTKVVYPDDLQSSLEVWRRAVESGAMYEVECRYRRASDGEYRWHLVRALPVGDQSEATREAKSWIGVIWDIHERKIAEQERARLLKEAQNANRAKDEFLAVVSHELRTPLNAILGWTEILRSGVDEATMRRALDVVERNGRAQVQIIEDILDVARLTTGKLRLQQAAQPFDFIIRDAINGVLPMAASKSIEIESHLTVSGSGAVVWGDSGRLRQVVWNLLSNAVKFTPEGGRVSIFLSRAPEHHLNLEITDTGQGIAPEFLPYVFERFRQADSSSTRSAGGLGLGLALVRSLVEMHGGRVEVSSPGENQGTTFSVFLPVYADQKASFALETQNPTKTPGRLAGVRILGLDDEHDARELLRLLLQREDAHVQIAASASEALALSHTETFDLVISDLAMPDADGFQLLKQLQHAHGDKLPVIALTAYAGQADREAVFQAGFAAYLAKPFRADDLVQTVQAVMGREVTSAT